MSKDEVLKADEAQKYYLGLLQTCDVPWLHWLIGICLEEKRESTSAQEEYLRCLELRLDPSDADAVRRRCRGRWQGSRICSMLRFACCDRESSTAKSAEDAAAAANALGDLRDCPTARGCGGRKCCSRRGRLFARRLASRWPKSESTPAKSRGRFRGLTRLKTGGRMRTAGSSRRPRTHISAPTSAYPACAATGPHCWRGHLGDAELHLSRAKTLQDEALSLIAADGASPASAVPAPKSPKNARATSPAPPTAEAESAKDVDLSTAPIDLKLLDVFIKRIQKGGPAMTDRAHAVSLCLTAAVQSLHEAVRHFDKAIGLNPDLIEAYRDRGLGYYRLAQCEAILAAVQIPDGSRRRRTSIVPWWTGERISKKRSCTWSM